MTDEDRLEVAELSFNEAMVSNDTARIMECIADEWVLVTPERGVIAGSDVLGLIASGDLTHDMMTKSTSRVHVMGDVATVTGRGQNSGTFRGAPIAADEWITDVYQRRGDRWLCVMTHLTPASQAGAPSEQ